jgi:hypothetical protein
MASSAIKLLPAEALDVRQTPAEVDRAVVEANDDALLAEQVAYYRARAPEYDDWCERRGRYDRGPDHTARWRAEVDTLRSALASADLTG